MGSRNYCIATFIQRQHWFVLQTFWVVGRELSEKARGKMSALCDIYKGAPWLDMKVKGEEVSEVFSLLQFTPKI